MANQPEFLKFIEREKKVELLLKAVAYGADFVVQEILSDYQETDTSKLGELIFLALRSGTFKIFNLLLENKELNEYFNQTLVIHCKKQIIESAIEGGQVDLFLQIWDACKKDKIPGNHLVNDLKFRGNSGFSRAVLVVEKAIQSP